MKLSIRSFTSKSYESSLQEMKHIVLNTVLEADQLWLLEHPPVFTQGITGKKEHIIQPSHIPVVQSDRGGQITYHGPGQMIGYTILNLYRLKIGIKQLIKDLLTCVVETLDVFGIQGRIDINAPGVYVNNNKICSIGLRIRKGICYHGIALNTNMDLTPFNFINPCGFEDLKMCQIRDFKPDITISEVKQQFSRVFTRSFGYTSHQTIQHEENLDVAV